MDADSANWRETREIYPTVVASDEWHAPITQSAPIFECSRPCKMSLDGASERLVDAVCLSVAGVMHDQRKEWLHVLEHQLASHLDQVHDRIADLLNAHQKQQNQRLMEQKGNLHHLHQVAERIHLQAGSSKPPDFNRLPNVSVTKPIIEIDEEERIVDDGSWRHEGSFSEFLPGKDAGDGTIDYSEYYDDSPIRKDRDDDDDAAAPIESKSSHPIMHALHMDHCRHAFAVTQGWIKEEMVKAESHLLDIAKAQVESGLERVVFSNAFDYLCAAMILANCVSIGLETDYAASNPHEDERKSIYGKLQIAFTLFFFVELVLKIAASRLRFFISPDWRWNLFDIVVVVIAMIDGGLYMFGNSKSKSSVTTLRALRILRLTRIMRFIRAMPFFLELRLMVFSTLACAKSLFWAILLLMLVMYIFGIHFTQAATDLIRREPDSDVQEHFGGLMTTMYTLFGSVSGGCDWIESIASLTDLSPYYAFAFCCYIAITLFAMMNVVTAIFVENSMKSAQKDRDIVIQNQMTKQYSYVQDVKLLFREADTDQSGVMSWAEFEVLLKNPRVQAFFASLELDPTQARGLFTLLDMDGTGYVDPNEFVHGCLRLKGQAKSVDVATLLYENKRMLHKWQSFMSYCEGRFNRALELEKQTQAGVLALMQTYGVSLGLDKSEASSPLPQPPLPTSLNSVQAMGNSEPKIRGPGSVRH